MIIQSLKFGKNQSATLNKPLTISPRQTNYDWEPRIKVNSPHNLEIAELVKSRLLSEKWSKRAFVGELQNSCSCMETEIYIHVSRQHSGKNKNWLFDILVKINITAVVIRPYWSYNNTITHTKRKITTCVDAY